MQMTSTEQQVVLVAALLLVFAVGYLVGRAVAAHHQLEHASHAAARSKDPLSDAWATCVLQDVLREVRAGGRRFEVQLVDFGADHEPGSMRFRWNIWDADRVLRQRLVGLDPEGEIGVVVPYMVGNVDTCDRALSAALSWLDSEEPGCVWVLPRG